EPRLASQPLPVPPLPFGSRAAPGPSVVAGAPPLLFGELGSRARPAGQPLPVPPPLLFGELASRAWPVSRCRCRRCRSAREPRLAGQPSPVPAVAVRLTSRAWSVSRGAPVLSAGARATSGS
ncbi:MAG TPA: hypothetical protein VGO80_11700, partial [Solirubrobacteraceae bacterium]|nr:hypothetical protein [Solirubrobacteraceae bacterium]